MRILYPSAGELAVVKVENPPAGRGFYVKVEDGWRWRLQSLAFTVTASLVAANRYLYYFIEKDGVVVYENVTFRTVVASQTWRCYIASGAYFSSDVLRSVANCPFPNDFYLKGWGRIGVTMTSLDVGDVFYNIFAYVERWFDPTS